MNNETSSSSAEEKARQSEGTTDGSDGSTHIEEDPKYDSGDDTDIEHGSGEDTDIEHSPQTEMAPRHRDATFMAADQEPGRYPADLIRPPTPLRPGCFWWEQGQDQHDLRLNTLDKVRVWRGKDNAFHTSLNNPVKILEGAAADVQTIMPASAEPDGSSLVDGTRMTDVYSASTCKSVRPQGSESPVEFHRGNADTGLELSYARISSVTPIEEDSGLSSPAD